MTCRPTPTSAALGRVCSGGTSISRSSVAAARQASRQPPLSSSIVNARGSTVSMGTEPLRTRTLHFLHVPWPPQVESIAIPFHDAASNTVVPAGTRTSPPSGRNCSRTLPVPAAAAASLIRHPWSANERGGVWGTGRFPTGSEEGGPVGETWFPPRRRAGGERCSRPVSEQIAHALALGQQVAAQALDDVLVHVVGGDVLRRSGRVLDGRRGLARDRR